MYIAWPVPRASFILAMDDDSLKRRTQLYNAGAQNSPNNELRALWQLACRVCEEELFARQYRSYTHERTLELELAWLYTLVGLEDSLASLGYAVTIDQERDTLKVSWSN
jgi:hypothetical protein